MAGEIVSPPANEKDNACAVLVSPTSIDYLPTPLVVLLAPPDLGGGAGGGGGARAYGFVA